MAHQHEGNTLRDVLRYEANEGARLSREVVMVASGQVLSLGAVIGKIAKAIATTGTADGGNGGGGTVATVTQGVQSKLGTYTIKAKTIVASPLEQVFEVTDPDGNSLPDAVAVGAYTSDQINFTIVEGSPVIEADDVWTIAVTDGALEVTEIAIGAITSVTGSGEAYGILTADCDASGGATAAVAIVRDAQIVADYLVWPDGSPAVSADEKATAMAQLLAKGIVAVEEA
jgi:hypothetical protein